MLNVPEIEPVLAECPKTSVVFMGQYTPHMGLRMFVRMFLCYETTKIDIFIAFLVVANQFEYFHLDQFYM